MRKVTEDRRTRKTRAAIEKAFMELMVKKELNKITVKDITDLADTNRSTFYTHYEDIYDLLDTIEDRVLEEMTAAPQINVITIITGGGHIDLTPALEYIKENCAVFRVLLHSSRSTEYMSKLSKIFERMLFSDAQHRIAGSKEEEYRKMITCFFANGVTAVVSRWINERPNIPSQTINSFIEDILRSGIEGLK